MGFFAAALAAGFGCSPRWRLSRFGRWRMMAHRKQCVQARSLAQRKNRLGHFVDGIALDEAVAIDAMHLAAARIQQAQIVVDFCRRGDGGARIARGVLLLDGDGGGKAVDLVHVRLFDSLKKLARIGGERFDIAPLPFGVDGVEGQRTLARPRHAADHRQLAVGNLAGDVLQIVCPRTADDDGIVQRIQWESTGKVFRPHPCALREAQDATSHSLL